MELEQLMGEAREAMSAKGVYGEPYEQNGVTVIPAAVVRGGGGGGGGSGPEGTGGRGGGFGLKASPSGAWVIEDGKVEWKPALDLNRAILGGQLVALAAVLTIRAFARPKKQKRRFGLGRVGRSLPSRPSLPRPALPAVSLSVLSLPLRRSKRRPLVMRLVPSR
jgi:uncharacterized spore protein YtfJ